MQDAMRTIVFLSHIAEEKPLALSLKKSIEAAFLDLVDVFVSSDPESIAFGQKWLDGISGALKSCAIELVLCSPISIQRPWINFEAGAGWVRGIPVVPLCHSGINKDKLPIPLKLLQAANLGDADDLQGIFAAIAASLRSKTPAIDFVQLASTVKAFEEEYTFWSEFQHSFMYGASYLAKSPVISSFLNGQDFSLDISDTATNELRVGLAFLLKSSLLTMTRNGNSMMTGNGMFFGTDFKFSPAFSGKLREWGERAYRNAGLNRQERPDV